MRATIILAMMALCSCNDGGSNVPVADSGVAKTSVRIKAGPDGLTAEQRNVRDRLVLDNTPGSIKHLYIISAYSGQTIIYSTVRGKVTSSGKRLSPSSVVVGDGNHSNRYWGYEFDGRETTEVLQDDGTYGPSVEYLFWWDSKGNYHQHYVTGGQIVHISDQPINVPSITINMESR